jgi:lipopolysaccharide export system protein LptC
MIKSNKIRQLLALFILAASLSLAAVIVLKIYQGRVAKELIRKLPKNIDVSIKKVHLTETRDGVEKWDLVSDKAEFNKEKEVTHLTGVRLVIAGGKTTGDITLTAPQADYHNISRDVDLKGRVMAKSASGMEFTTDGARYIADRAVIVSSGKVRFSDGKLTLEGVGMEFKPGTKNFRILSGVTADILLGTD